MTIDQTTWDRLPEKVKQQYLDGEIRNNSIVVTAEDMAGVNQVLFATSPGIYPARENIFLPKDMFVTGKKPYYNLVPTKGEQDGN